MSEPYVGEIRIWPGNFAPSGWMICDGSILPIAEYDVLFNLIGTTYGGDGQSTFALPDLRGRIPVHAGPGFVMGQSGGVEQVTLTTNQMPAHIHVPQAQTGAGTQSNPGGGVWAASPLNQFSPNIPNAQMSPNALGSAGGSQPHDNMMPYLAINFIISLFGVYPSS